MTDRAYKLFIAGVAYEAGRYDDVAEEMKFIAKMDGELSKVEQDILTASFKKVINRRRSSWKTICTIEKENEPGSFDFPIIKSYRCKIEKEIKNICNDAIDLLNEHLIVKATTPEAKVLFFRMKGDYISYMFEISRSDERRQFAKNALLAYEEAAEIAVNELTPNNDIRLELALKLTAFYKEMSCTEKDWDLVENARNELVDWFELSDPLDIECNPVVNQLNNNFKAWAPFIDQDKKSDEDQL